MNQVTELWTVETRASDGDTWAVMTIRYRESDALDAAGRYRSADVKARVRRFVPAREESER
jgi:hypothetical protein